MGYTHYWDVKKPFTAKNWLAFVKDAKKLIKTSSVHLAGPRGKTRTKPILNISEVSFNGVEDDAHETCRLTPGYTGFDFCKTAEKPYDKIVVDILMLARKYNPSIKLSSDGGPEIFN